MFDPGFDITPTTDPMGFTYGPDCFGPDPENRTTPSVQMMKLRFPVSGETGVAAAIQSKVLPERLLRSWRERFRE